MVTRDDILAVLRTIDDPEMPISIVDLGMVEHIDLEADPAQGTRVAVTILPTFVGCPALPVIEGDIRRRVAALPGIAAVEVQSTFAPAWNVDRITPAGRESLRRIGVTVPAVGQEHSDQPPSCPFCGASAVHQESPFGPTRCRQIWYCDACRNSFEHMKRVGTGLVELTLDRLGTR
jgi:ring-1,2-phenylacetyl-CoA epoxidase subunit PaaD